MVKLRESPRRRKEREVFFVEGGSELITLAKAGRKVQELYFCRDTKENMEQDGLLMEFREMGIETIETSRAAFSKASYRSAGHGIIGLVGTWALNLEPDSFSGSGPLVVLDEVEKPGNLGAILRSIEAFGGAGVLLSDPAVDYFNPNVVRSSRGLMGRVPAATGNKDEVLNWLQNSGRKIIATSSRAHKDLGKEKMPRYSAFVFGSEKFGLGEHWQNQSVEWIKIPMNGSASSLNLNVSVACLLYEYCRN